MFFDLPLQLRDLRARPALSREVIATMELVVRKTDLLRELQLFQGIVERKNTIPILANVLLEAKGDQVKLLATDLEVGLRSTCTASVAKGGSLTLPAKKLYEIIKALPETDVRIEEDKNGVKVAADRFDSRMQTLPREDFPTLPEATGSISATLGRDVVKQMVLKTQFAITGEDTRYFLNGALFILRGDSMSLVSTDGHRLALVTVPREKGKTKGRVEDDAEDRVILPRKTLLELGRLLGEGEGDIQYERGENHLFFDIGGRLLISRMIDGQFPAFERVIPKANDKRVEFDRDRLTSAVRRVALLSNERSRAVKFQFDKGKVEIASSSPEFGEAKEVLNVDYTAAPVTICFNAQYVVDFLGAVETDSIALEFKDEMSQAVLSPIGAEGYTYTYVIMPMRV
ncbi:MAG TPA: DNA polymerase III subunit beta [Vicinamibacterales bacterium]